MPAPFHTKRTAALPLWSPGNRRWNSSTFSQADDVALERLDLGRGEDRRDGVGQSLQEQRLILRLHVPPTVGRLDPLGVRRDQVRLARLHGLGQLLQVTVRVPQKLAQGDLVVAHGQGGVVLDRGLQPGRGQPLARRTDAMCGIGQAGRVVERRQAQRRVAHGR